jgi:hypothetical protein
MIFTAFAVVLAASFITRAAVSAQTTAPAPARAQPTLPAPTTAPHLTTPPATQPVLRPGQRSAEEMLRQMLKPASEQPRPLQPIPDAGAAIRTDRSTLDTVAPGATTRPLLPEGSFIVDRLARLTRHGPGVPSELSFVSDGQAMSDPPLIALPNSELAALERLVDSTRSDPVVWISGMLTQYNGRNYILLQRWSQVNDNANPLK